MYMHTNKKYIYIYVYTYICVYTYIFIYIYIYLYIYICVQIGDDMSSNLIFIGLFYNKKIIVGQVFLAVMTCHITHVPEIITITN